MRRYSKNPANVAARKKKKLTQRELWATFGLNMPSYRRYDGLKGVYWHVLSKYVRMRDFVTFGGKCISCPTVLEQWYQGDAGHYLAARDCGFGLLLDPMNVHLQCKRCNNPSWSPSASIAYGFELDRRYGNGTAQALYKRKGDMHKEWSQTEYDIKIREMLGNIEALGVDNRISY